VRDLAGGDLPIQKRYCPFVSDDIPRRAAHYSPLAVVLRMMLPR